MTNNDQTGIYSLELLKKGDQKSFKIIFNTYYKVLFEFVQNLTKDSFKTEDIVQETFIRLWKNKEKIDNRASVKNYLYKTAYNNFIDKYRKDQRTKVLKQEWYFNKVVELSEESIEIQEKKKEKLRTVIDTLPPKCKQVFVLSKFEGLKYKEISEQLNISIKTVENQMSIALSKLRTELKNSRRVS